MLCRYLAVCSAVILSMSAPLTAGAAEDLSEQERALWERHWRSYAKQCAEFEVGFLVCPRYDKRYPSSAGMTVRQAEAELSQKVRVRGGGVVVTKTLTKPVEEAKAMALTIPKLKIGEYGYLASVEVDEVLGEKSMLVEDIYLIDPAKMREDFREDRKKVKKVEEANGDEDIEDAEEQLDERYKYRRAVLDRQKEKRHHTVKIRLEGFSTAGLAKRDRWAGPDGEGIWVVIARDETYGRERRPRHRLVAVSLDKFKWRLTEEAFVRLLAERGLDRARLVGLIQERMAERKPAEARVQVLHAIQRGKAPESTESQRVDDQAEQAKEVDEDNAKGRKKD